MAKTTVDNSNDFQILPSISKKEQKLHDEMQKLLREMEDMYDSLLFSNEITTDLLDKEIVINKKIMKTGEILINKAKERRDIYEAYIKYNDTNQAKVPKKHIEDVINAINEHDNFIDKFRNLYASSKDRISEAKEQKKALK